MRNIAVIAKREIASYFATPLAYIFIVIFLALTGAFAFYVGGFFIREQADLEPFFVYHPWLYLMLIPAVAMRLWAEERKTGTIEVLMTLMAGAFLAIGSCISSLTKNQVIAFIVAATVCFLFTLSGLELVLNFFRAWAPELLIRTIASMSFLSHFTAVTKGVIEFRDLVFFASLIVFWLFANVVAVDFRKAA
ncbi:MAG: ABC transporter permease [Rhodospirillales bacterium]|nr:ABC transporter permease [Rhodospirillales bacterium]